MQHTIRYTNKNQGEIMGVISNRHTAFHPSLRAEEAIAQTVHDSRITHETSNIVELMWEKEGIVDDKAAHLNEAPDTSMIRHS